MKSLYYFSRNYVEFGTFTAEEIADFKKRGILSDHDYVRAVGMTHWETVERWVAKHAEPKVPAKASPKAKAPATRKKAAATTKASKKAA